MTQTPSTPTIGPATEEVELLSQQVAARPITLDDLLIGIDPVSKRMATDTAREFLNRYVPQLIAAHESGLSEARVNQLIVNAVRSFARATATGPIPLKFIDVLAILAMVYHQASYPRDEEVLITSQEFTFDARANTRLTLDAGQTLPEAGTIYLKITDPSDSKVVAIDAAALYALSDATENINWRDPDDPADTSSFMHVANAVSQDEDSNFNLGFLVGKDAATGNNFLLVQLDGNTTLTRQVEATAIEFIPFDSGTRYDEVTHVLSVPTRVGENTITTTYQLSAAGVVNPNTEPPDVHYHHTIPQNSLTIVADPNSTVIPEGGSFSIKIDGLVYSDHHFTYNNLRSKTAVAAGDGGTTDSSKGIRIPGVTGYVYRSAANHPLIWLRDTTAARDVELVDHQIANLETGLTIFDQTYTSSVVRDVFQVDDNGEEYNPDTDGIADLFINGVREEVITKTLWNNLARVADNEARTNQGQEYTGKGYLARAGNKPAWCVRSDSQSWGTVAFPQHLEIKKRPVSYVRTDSFNALWGARWSTLAGGTYDAESGVVEALWTTPEIADLAITTGKIADGAVTSIKIANDAVTGDKIQDGAVGREQLDAVERSKIDKTDVIAEPALTTSTAQWSNAKIPLPSVTQVSRASDIPANTGGVHLYEFTADDGSYHAGDVVLRAASGLEVIVTSRSHIYSGESFPSAAAANSLFVLTRDNTLTLFTDRDGTMQTQGYEGDWFKYSGSSWRRIVPVETHRPSDWATKGNSKRMPASKMPFPVVLPAGALPTTTTGYDLGARYQQGGHPVELLGALPEPIPDADKNKLEVTIRSQGDPAKNAFYANSEVATDRNSERFCDYLVQENPNVVTLAIATTTPNDSGWSSAANATIQLKFGGGQWVTYNRQDLVHPYQVGDLEYQRYAASIAQTLPTGPQEIYFRDASRRDIDFRDLYIYDGQAFQRVALEKDVLLKDQRFDSPPLLVDGNPDRMDFSGTAFYGETRQDFTISGNASDWTGSRGQQPGQRQQSVNAHVSLNVGRSYFSDAESYPRDFTDLTRQGQPQAARAVFYLSQAEQDALGFSALEIRLPSDSPSNTTVYPLINFLNPQGTFVGLVTNRALNPEHQFETASPSPGQPGVPRDMTWIANFRTRDTTATQVHYISINPAQARRRRENNPARWGAWVRFFTLSQSIFGDIPNAANNVWHQVYAARNGGSTLTLGEIKPGMEIVGALKVGSRRKEWSNRILVGQEWRDISADTSVAADFGQYIDMGNASHRDSRTGVKTLLFRCGDATLACAFGQDAPQPLFVGSPDKSQFSSDGSNQTFELWGKGGGTLER